MNQTTDNRWEQVGRSKSDNQRWEPYKNIGNPNYPTQLEGYFKEWRECTGSNGVFMVAGIVLVNQDGTLGNTIDVSGGKVLDDRLSDITIGSYIMIKYGGKAKSKTSNSYNVWEVFVDRNAIPFAQLGGVTSNRSVQSLPPQNIQAATTQNNPFNPAQGFGGNQQPVQGNPFGSSPVQNNPFGSQVPNNTGNFGQAQQQAPAQNNPVKTGNVDWSQGAQAFSADGLPF